MVDDSEPDEEQQGTAAGEPEDADLERSEDDATRTAREAREHVELERMAAWVAGDREAGELLIRAYIGPITRSFQGKVHDPEVVKTLVSEWCEQLVRSPRVVRTTVKAYLYGIARNILRHHFRDKASNREDAASDTLADLDAESSWVSNQRVETRAVLRAMRRININQAMAIEMRWFEGFSGPEIAEILDAPQGTVRGYLRLGLVNLQREILRASDAEVVKSVTTTYTWLAGLIRQIEALKAQKVTKPPDQ